MSKDALAAVTDSGTRDQRLILLCIDPLPAKRPKKKKRRGDPAGGVGTPPNGQESRGAEALTVLWMLTALATLLAESVAAAVWIALAPRETGAGASLGLLPAVMLFTALVTGTICLSLTPLVRRLRATPPPRGIVVAALLIGASPWVLLAGAMARG